MSRFAGASGAEWRSTRRAVLVGACAALATCSLDGLNGAASAQLRTEDMRSRIGSSIRPGWSALPANSHDQSGCGDDSTGLRDCTHSRRPSDRLVRARGHRHLEANHRDLASACRGAAHETGLSLSDTIVIYDGGSFFSARLWWILDQLGHANKRILDGGLDAWISGGQPLETGRAGRALLRSLCGKASGRDIANLDMVASCARRFERSLIDTRSPGEYEQGHIPGAINLDHMTYTSGQGRRRPAPQSTCGQCLPAFRRPAKAAGRPQKACRAKYDEAGAPAR